MIAYDEFVQVEEGPHVFTVYTDIDKLETHMKTLSPVDAKVIEEFTNAARRFTGVEIFALPIASTGESSLVRPLWLLPSFQGWSGWQNTTPKR